MGEGGFVWSDDDANEADEESSLGDARGHASPGDDTGSGSPFADLLDRIDRASGHSADVEDLTADLPPGEALDDPVDIERIVERVRERGTSEGRPSVAMGDRSETRDDTGASPDPPGETFTEPSEDVPAPSDTRPLETEDDTRETPVPFDDLADEPIDGEDERSSADAEAADPEAPDPEKANPFGELVDGLDREAAGGKSRGTPGRVGAVDGDRFSSVPPGAVPDDASSLLLLNSSEDGSDFETCLSLFRETRPSRTNLLLVWLSRDIADRLEQLYEGYADPSTDVTVVCRRKVGREFQANATVPSDATGENLSFNRISDPRDLPKLGIAISQVVSSWEGRPKHVTMCFDSITDLLQFASHERVFRFLHVLQGRIDSVDATAHYHLNPDSHDERTIAMFSDLFDATVDVTAETEDHRR